jgi:hypothetical protein
MSSKSRSMKTTGKRSFTINNAYHVDGCPTKFTHNDFSGRYLKHHPEQAAKNALSHLCKVKRIRGQCTLYIEIRETTQGSSGKVFAYHAKRIHLKKPIVLKDRTIYYKPVVKSVEHVPTEHCKKSHKSRGRMVSLYSKHNPGISKRRHSSSKSIHRNDSKPLTKRVTNTIKSTMKSVRNSLKRATSSKH